MRRLLVYANMHFKFSRALSVGRMQKWTPIFLEPLFQAERLKYKLESIFDSYNAKLEILQDEFKKSANTSQDFDEDFIEKESRICFQCNLEIQAVIRDAEREPNMRIVDLPKLSQCARTRRICQLWAWSYYL